MRDARSEQRSRQTQYLRFSVCVPESYHLIDVHLGFRRATDLDAADKPAQDYAVARGEDGYVVGIVADGVSQSFYGNLAAYSLSEQLLTYLWEARTAPPSEEAITAALVSFQDALRDKIAQYQLPETLPSLLRKALETTRNIDGSQAVFSAFILNGMDGTCHLYEVGDVVALARYVAAAEHDDGVELIKADPKGRWSSSGRTKLRLQVALRAQVTGIIVKSDGAKDWGTTLNESEVSEESFRSVADGLADYDDVSFVAAFLQPAPAQEPLATDESIEPPPALPPYTPMYEEESDYLVGAPDSELHLDGRSDERQTGPSLKPARNWRRNYIGVFTAGMLAGVSLMLLLFCFLALAGLLRWAAGARVDPANTRKTQLGGETQDGRNNVTQGEPAGADTSGRVESALAPADGQGSAGVARSRRKRSRRGGHTPPRRSH